MDGDQASAYGDRHARVYDQIYGLRFSSEAAVETLTLFAGRGTLLEMGLGTGRLAIPLVAAGVTVEGIEASDAMIARLHNQPGGQQIVVHQVDLADFELPRSDYAVAVCAVSTLFMLAHDRQRTSVQAAARHLRPGGKLIVEAFHPDPSRFDPNGRRVEIRMPALGTHTVRSKHDPIGHSIRVEHELDDGGGAKTYGVTLYYADTADLDAMADHAGLQLVERWHDWTRSPVRSDSTDPISVYEK